MLKELGRKTELLKFITGLTAIALFTGVAAAISSPNVTETVSKGQAVNFSVQASQGENLELELLPPKKPSKTFKMNYSNGQYRKELLGSNFLRKGLYRYRFKKGDQIFPEEGYFGLTVSSLNRTLENTTLNVSDTESGSGVYCNYKSEVDFDCEFEHYQAGMILSSAIGLQLNSSTYAKEKFENFTFGRYGQTFQSKCDQNDSVFSCSSDSIDDPDVKSGTRQGALINSLWKAYGLTDNSSVRRLALNYTQGSAETCNVWDNTFECNSSRAQALMALGYWSAYTETGNGTFKSIAENLTRTNNSHPLMASAYLQGYKFTGNSSYLDKAKNLTKNWLRDCPNCTKEDFLSLKNSLWTGYRVTGDYGYYRNAVNLTTYRNGSYCSWNDNSCSDPFLQGLFTQNYWKAYKGQKDVSVDMFNPEIDEETVVGRNLSINIEMQGKLRTPKVLYRERSSGTGSWRECDIDFFEGCDIPGENISKQAPYSYKFKSEKTSFPANGTLSFAPSLVKDTFLDEAVSFTRTDPGTHCAPSEGDFSCEDRALQAPMITGFSDYYKYNYSLSSQNYLDRILSRPYVTSLIFEPLCTEKDGYIGCENGGSAPEQEQEGSVRQGKMIKSLFNAYDSNQRPKTLQRALNYTRGSAEDCDVWNRTYPQSFECGSSKGQAEMLEAYLKAYKVTGNSTFRNIALNLTEEAVNMGESSELGSALWKAGSYFNETYRNISVVEKAENISAKYTGYCTGNCSPSQYLGVTGLFKESYLWSSDSYADQYRNSLLNTTESGSCGPYKRDISCSSPADQGGFMDLMWGSAYTMPVQIKVDDSFNASQTTVTVGQDFSTTCSARNNLENTTLRNVRFDLEVSEGLSPVSNNTSYTAGDLEYGNSSQVSWDIEATSAGSRNASCAITSDSGYRDTINQDIIVEAQEQEETQSSGPETSSPSFGGGFIGTEEERNFTVNYTITSNTSNITWNRSFLQEIGSNITYRNFTKADTCSKASRMLQGENTTLTVRSNCTGYELLLIDKVPANTSVKGQNTSEYAVRKRENLTEETVMKIEYRGLNNSEFRRPLILTSEYSLPKVRFSNLSTKRNSNSSAVISAELNRKASCSIYNGSEKLYSAETSHLQYEASLPYGNHTYRVECGKTVFTKSFSRERSESPGQELSLPVYQVLGGLVLLGLAAAVYYREKLVDWADMKLFEYRFSRFESAVGRGDTAEAIEIFDSMSRDISQEVLESDMDLMQGLMLYLLLDMVEEGKRDDVAFDVSEDMDDLVQRYLEGSEGKAMKLVEQKYQEVMSKDVEVV